MLLRSYPVVPIHRPMPYQYRAPALSVSRRKELGQSSFSDVKFNWGNLGETIMFASFGAGAVYGAGLLPDPVKTIAMVGGIGLLGYAAYSFVGGSAKKSTTDPTKPYVGTSPTVFAKLSAGFIQPIPGSTEQFSWFSDKYVVKALATNPSPEDATVVFQLIAREFPGWYGIIPFGETEEYVAGDPQVVKIPAGVAGGSGSQPVEFSPSVRTSRWISPAMMVTMTLRMIRVAGSSDPADIRDVAHTNVILKG